MFVQAWRTQRRDGVIARVIRAEGLGLRPSADLLVIDATGRTGGSLLAGAVQPEIITAARRLLETRNAFFVVSLVVDSDDAAAAGLTCGGAVEVLVQRLDTIPNELWETLASGRPAALVTVIGNETASMVVYPGGATVGSLGQSGLDTLAQAETEPMLTHSGSRSTPSVCFAECSLMP